MIPNNYQCEGQMNIWELNLDGADLPQIEKVIQIVSDMFGIVFKESIADWDNSGRKVFTRKYPKAELEIHDSHLMENHKRIVSVWWNGKDWGIGHPCEDMDEVISAIKKGLEKVK